MTRPPAPARYAPDRDLPRYRHRLGRTPHPRTNPEGHSWGSPEPESPPLTHDNWRRHEAWLFGIDLFNRGYWWEAHEWWEAAWHATRDDAMGHLLQGLIQLAAAWLKWEDGNRKGRRGLWRRSRDHLLAATTEGSSLAGLEVACVVDGMDRLFAHNAVRPDPVQTQDLPRLSLSPDLCP